MHRARRRTAHYLRIRRLVRAAARYYDPESGQYASQDPIRLAGGLRLGAYPSDPLVAMDPLGLAPIGSWNEFQQAFAGAFKDNGRTEAGTAWNLMEMNDGSKINVSPDGGDGPGTGSTIVYEPANWPSEKAPGSPSDVVLAHEMNHAANNAEGKGQGGFEPTDQEYKDTWTNPEEENTVGSENRYREQRGGVPQRTGGYGPLP